jgi:trigger factor
LSYPDAYDGAVEEAKLDVVGRADIDIKDFDENGEGFVFTAKVPVRPEVKLGQYKGLSAEKRRRS